MSFRTLQATMSFRTLQAAMSFRHLQATMSFRTPQDDLIFKSEIFSPNNQPLWAPKASYKACLGYTGISALPISQVNSTPSREPCHFEPFRVRNLPLPITSQVKGPKPSYKASILHCLYCPNVPYQILPDTMPKPNQPEMP